MNKIYAHLNSDNICEAITKYETPLDSPPSIYKELESFDESLLGKKWNGSSWEAVEVDNPPPHSEIKAEE